MLTQAELKRQLHYDPSTGKFTRLLKSHGRRKAGSEAGSIVRRKHLRYRQICVNYVTYTAHRLAWLYMTGEWPPAGHVIDHINGDGTCNCWINLRLATPGQNCANSRRPSTNTTGYKGVTRTREGKFIAAIRANGKTRHLGVFDEAIDAHTAYREAGEQLWGPFHHAGKP